MPVLRKQLGRLKLKKMIIRHRALIAVGFISGNLAEGTPGMTVRQSIAVIDAAHAADPIGSIM
jgi:hypothetical protein